MCGGTYSDHALVRHFLGSSSCSSTFGRIINQPITTTTNAKACIAVCATQSLHTSARGLQAGENCLRVDHIIHARNVHAYDLHQLRLTNDGQRKTNRIKMRSTKDSPRCIRTTIHMVSQVCNIDKVSQIILNLFECSPKRMIELCVTHWGHSVLHHQYDFDCCPDTHHIRPEFRKRLHRNTPPPVSPAAKQFASNRGVTITCSSGWYLCVSNETRVYCTVIRNYIMLLVHVLRMERTFKQPCAVVLFKAVAPFVWWWQD